jgi:integrase
MGRRRTKTPAWLPPRVYPHWRQYLYRPLNGKPIALGPISDPGLCLKRYAEIVGDNGKTPRLLSEVIDKYLTEVVPAKAPRTREDYRAYCAELKKRIGHFPPDEVTINDLYEYHEKRKAPTRANREIAVLRSIYRHAIKWRAAGSNPAIGFIHSDERPRDRVVSGSERRRFMANHCAPWLRGYLALKLLTGRRQGELLKLTIFSEKPSGISFRILKKRQERELIVQWTPRLRRVWKWLKSLPRPSTTPAIFIGERGSPVNARSLKSVWQRAMQKWGSDGNERFWEHDLRAYTAGAAGSDERARELLDHGSLATTRRSYRRTTAKVRPLR